MDENNTIVSAFGGRDKVYDLLREKCFRVVILN